MKASAKAIAALIAILAMALVVFFAVRLALDVMNGLGRGGGAPVDGEAVENMAATPMPGAYLDEYFDGTPVGAEPAGPTPSPEVMVTVPVEETIEELAEDGTY